MVTLRSALFLILFLWNLQLVLAGIVNRTIDDGFGDSDTLQKVTYLPTTSTVWKNASCGDCFIRPNTSRAFRGTYTAATYNPQLGSMSITMKFNGTAIYVFFILANNAGEGITSLTLANFTLDGTNPELFERAPDLSRTDIDYNQLVYSKQDLINAEHTLVISTSGVNTDVYVNFDYVIYSHDDDAPLLPLPLPSSSGITASASVSSPAAPNTSDTKSSAPVGPIVAGVVGGVVLLLLIIFLLLFCRRRRTRGRHKSEVEPYVGPLMHSRINPQAATVTPFKAQPTAAKTSGGEERADPNSVETIRRARQNKIDERLRAAQQEVTRLTSDLGGERGSGSQLRRRANTQGDEAVGEEGEMSMAEMREQLRVMQEQIGFLRDQQGSAWAQGLSDNPPPGYTLTPALRDSGSTVVPPS